MGRKSTGEKLFSVINTIIMIFMMSICLYPLLYVLFASLSDPTELAQNKGFLLMPKGLTFKGYWMVLKNPNISTGYINTTIYVVAGTCINLILTSLGAYVLSRKNLYWRNRIMLFIVFTMFFHGGLIPRYLIVKDCGLLDTRWAMLIPNAILTWNLIVMRTSFMGIPDSLEESAKMDGANDFTVLFLIILPLSKAVLAVMILFYGVGHWNQWFDAMLFLRKRNLYPLQLFLREILLSNQTDDMMANAAVEQTETDLYRTLIQYTTIIVATVPILFLYPFVQKHFTKGVMVGALKG